MAATANARQDQALALRGRLRRHRLADDRYAERAVNTLSRDGARRAGNGAAAGRGPDRFGRDDRHRAAVGQGLRLHRRRRHLRVRRDGRPCDPARGAAAHACAVRPDRGVEGAGGRRLSTASASAAASNWRLPATTGSPSTTTRRGSVSPRSISASSRVSAVLAGPSGRRARSTRCRSMLTGTDAARPARRAAWASSTSWCGIATTCAGKRARPCCRSASRTVHGCRSASAS